MENLLNFSGVGSAFTPELGNTSAYFFNKNMDTLNIIDAGESVFSIMKNSIDSWDRFLKDVNIFITHMHSDHIGSLGTLIFYLYYKKKIVPTIIYPDIDNMVNFLSLTGVKSDLYNIVDEIDGFVIIPSEHTPELESYSYLFKYRDSVIYYSGDSVSIRDEILEKFKEGKIDIMYQDCSSLNYEGMVHMSLDKLDSYNFTNLEKTKIYIIHRDTFNNEVYQSHGYNVVEI